MSLTRKICRISDNITKVLIQPEQQNDMGDTLPDPLGFSYEGKMVLLETGVSFSPKEVTRYVIDGDPVIKKKKTANGEVSYIENAREEFLRTSYEAELSFEVGETERLMGLGQYEDGFFDYRNRTEYLYESNMRIGIPFLVTDGHYGIYLDQESSMIFRSEGRRVTFSIDTTGEITYYVITGNTVDEIISGYQQVTGKASMLPRWAFGYIQSKERYRDADELVRVAEQFRKRDIPLDCLVQDWYTWEEGLWGEKIFDKKRYPDLPGTVERLHDAHVRLMVSVWPNMSPDSENYARFRDRDLLLPNSNLYDCFSEEARALYFDQCRQEIMAAGCDALWCDNAEPFSDADWNGQKKRPEQERYDLVIADSKRSMEWEKLNAYGLYHAQGIYENWRKHIPEKRVVNLTRSGYAGCQRYGTILWSGDITAKWSTLKKQITEGLKMGLSGMPYWTLDIGGFFVVKDKYENRGCNNTSTEPLWFWDGDYNEGVADLGYCELYTRWIQFGCFLPVFRSHGTDTPREPWNFGEPFYDVIVKFIRLRYRLMPYIYSLGAMAHRDSYIMMRSLVFDFGQDPYLRSSEGISSLSDQYLFGSAFLVAPVTEPMYYDADSKVLENREKYRSVYLPKGTLWYDFWTGNSFEGGKTHRVLAPLEQLPLFVRAGSIVPMGQEICHTDDAKDTPLTLCVYEGADGAFSLYSDAGDGYDFAQGRYCLIRMEYADREKTLTLHEAEGSYEIPSLENICFFGIDGRVTEKPVVYEGKTLIIQL